MAFIQALSGLYGASAGLDVIGNNLANSSTVGFKNSRAEFSDIFHSYLKNEPGNGAYAPTVEQQFNQGTLNRTNRQLDFSINGNGMFQLSTATDPRAGVAYTRNGEFHFEPVPNSNGAANEKYIVNANGGYLTGWANGVATTETPSVLKLADPVAGKATTSSSQRLNLDDRSAVPTTATFDPADPTSFNWASNQKIHSGVTDDTKLHDLDLYFVKTATPNTWNVYTRIDGQPPAESASEPRQLVFSATGLLSSGGNFTSTGKLTAESRSVNPLTGATTELTTTVTVPIAIDLGLSSQFAVGSEAFKSEQNGYKNGYLQGVSLDPDGVIQGTYSNGKVLSAGKVALATFVNPNGLKSNGGNLWQETVQSGAANIGAAGEKGRGVTESNSLEQSNVDTASQLVEMITMQRNYQANAQTIKTQDDVLKTLTALR